MDEPRDFVPALGRPELTASYDRVIAVMTREKRWRGQLLKLVAPQESETIVDVGCGTGTFAIMLKMACPDARVVAIDPDPQVLEIARGKALAADLTIDWRQGFGDDFSHIVPNGAADKVVSSLVLHQCPPNVKRSILAAMHTALRPSGLIAIADYGAQRSLLMRLLFRQVQALDGFENTQPNADGVVPRLMAEVGFENVQELRVVPTPTGSISLYAATVGSGADE